MNIRSLFNLSKYFFQWKFSKYPVRPIYYPLTIALEVTTKCNLSCLRCERQAVPQETLGHDMNMETVKKIAPIFSYAKSVSLVGLGEPFLNPNFWTIHEMVKKSGAEVAYFSNGLLLSPENIERTFNQRTDYLFLDLDSLDSEKYKEIKGGSDLNQIIGLIREIVHRKRILKRSSPKIMVNCSVQKDTLEEMPKIVEFAARQGIDKIWFTGVMSHIPETIQLSLFQVEFKKIAQLFKITKEKASKLGVEIRLPEINPFNKACRCQEPWLVMHIFYNGDVCACCHFRCPKKYYFYVKDGKLHQDEIDYPDLVMGNVHQESVLEIWTNQKYTDLREQIKKGIYRLPCSYCYYAYGWH
jgi:MoaA/NifB/PqqE/SkfB family radical SAM enzyme